MDILSCQEAFGAGDITTAAMGRAIAQWFDLYYRADTKNGEDPCQRIAYTAVSRVVRTVFAEYGFRCDDPFGKRIMEALCQKKETAMQLALVGGEVYLKPWVTEKETEISLIPRDQILIFGRNPDGEPTDVGTLEKSVRGSRYYTLLERRRVDEKGYLTIENRLFRSTAAELLGKEVSLKDHPLYEALPRQYTYRKPVGSVGLVRVATPMLNCVDGSADGVSLYAPAVGLIHAIDRNEFLLREEFERGQSRVFASSDLLRQGQLADNLFVGLEDDPERIGLTVYAPQLRQEAFLERKREYLRNVESVIGLKRGLLSNVNSQRYTATEIDSSAADQTLTVLDFQRMWDKAVKKTLALCACLGELYGIRESAVAEVFQDWGNGTLYEEDKLWQDYKDMVSQGILKPEVALGWRFHMPVDTPEALARIRETLMPSDGKS